jgi:phosphonate transport system substrate-binding protein
MFKKLLTTLFALGLALSLAPAFAQDQAAPKQLVLGMIPSVESSRIVDTLQPLGDMLSDKLGIPVKTFVSTEYTGMVEAIGSGKVDIAMLGPAAMVQAHDRYGAQIVLASVRNGSTSYKSQFTVMCDSGIKNFSDLKGKTIAFVDPASASGYQFPYVFLKKHGINPDKDMTSIFAGSHDAAMLALINGDVDVAATYNDVRDDLVKDYPDIMKKTCILGYSEPIPNDGVVVSKNISPELTAKISQALIDIANSEKGKKLLETLINVTGFAPIKASAYDVVREVSQTFSK